ncbi:DUF721 domain-containing protein [Cetobacterium sp. 2A]|uniref:DUF721 domain-containing protein n=1 Tax=Cetobacterium sp. 2A TaxID=2754723 RepID=UPI00163CE8C0|nr:DUF721 domain-containing protein [Cetobacterium sp. 2A]MBC2856224.1 DUF721 domain-containing protein [Cetobacterium sp. 2A]
MTGINSVKDIVDEAIMKSRKLKEGIIKARWSEIVGKLYLKSNPLWIKEEVLYVLVEDSVFMHHMNMNKNKYIAKIEEILKDTYVKDIRFKISKIEKAIDNKELEMYMNKNKDKPKPSVADEVIKTKGMSIEESIEYLRVISNEREQHLLNLGYKKCKRCGTMFKGEESYCLPCIKGNDKECIFT